MFGANRYFASMRASYIFILCLPLFLGACRPAKPVAVVPPKPVAEEAFDTLAVIRDLAAEYKNGMLTRCVIDSAVVYFGAINAPDAGAEAYDIRGKKIGECYFSTNRVDPICEKMYDCQDLYRVSPNIWGQPGQELKLVK